MISATPPTSVATTGTPDAIASSSASGVPSCQRREKQQVERAVARRHVPTFAGERDRVANRQRIGQRFELAAHGPVVDDHEARGRALRPKARRDAHEERRILLRRQPSGVTDDELADACIGTRAECLRVDAVTDHRHPRRVHADGERMRARGLADEA
jgi:hypothetical protein